MIMSKGFDGMKDTTLTGVNYDAYHFKPHSYDRLIAVQLV